MQSTMGGCITGRQASLPLLCASQGREWRAQGETPAPVATPCVISFTCCFKEGATSTGLYRWDSPFRASAIKLGKLLCRCITDAGGTALTWDILREDNHAMPCYSTQQVHSQLGFSSDGRAHIRHVRGQTGRAYAVLRLNPLCSRPSIRWWSADR
ncbi:hypothetical protein LZ30DRAFT_385502 [Colletotrichum cereale]|nr:hypothetical protein LZ30DRAFT_385502 [Colletotrichum cereale]